jgi:uncharacterized protein involved in cysteine biosynthesis
MEPEPAPTTSPAGSGTAPYPAVTGSVWARLRRSAAVAWEHARSAQPPPPREDQARRFWYGLQQPLLGMRLLLRDEELLSAALLPVLAVAAVCTIAGVAAATAVTELPWWSFGNATVSMVATFLVAFATTFLAVAPVPPFLFARHYAKMAARARDRLGTGPCEPYLKPISQAVSETITQMGVIAIGLAPLTLLATMLPLVGAGLAIVLQLAWTMHWMVVEAFDNGRTLVPGTTVAQVQREEEAHARREPPWLLRAWQSVPTRGLANAVAGPLRAWSEVLTSVTRGWAPEMRMIERDRSLAVGFALGVAVLLAIPIVSLLFRPALVIAAANLRGQLEREAAASPGAPTVTDRSSRAAQ